MTEKTHHYTTEVITHYVCCECKLWWSFAGDGYIPIEMTCPHCGHQAYTEQFKH